MFQNSLTANAFHIVGMPPSEVTEKLQLHKLKDRVWYVVPSCATTGEGLFEGLVSSTRAAKLEALFQYPSQDLC